MLYTTKENPLFQILEVKGSERVDKNVEEEEEALTSHKSVIKESLDQPNY